MSLSPMSMKFPTASDHRRQLTRAISYGQWLLDAWQAHRRKSFDLDFRQLDFIVDVGRVAQRSKFKDTRNRQPCRHAWMIQQKCREMPPGRPTRQYDGPRNTVRAGLRGEPVKRGSQLSRDLRQARVRGQSVAGQRRRPPAREYTLSHTSKYLLTAALPITTVDID